MIYLVLPSGEEVVMVGSTSTGGSKSNFKVWIEEEIKNNNMAHRDDEVMETVGTGASSVVSNHDHKAYLQYKINEPLNSSGYKVSKGGCGLCSFTSIMYEFGVDKTPIEWRDWFEAQSPGFMDSAFVKGSGMQWCFPGNAIATLNKSGIYGQYKIVESISQTGAINNNKVIKTLQKYADDPNISIMISAGKGLFTNGGHIMHIPCVVDKNRPGVHIADSSNIATKKLLGNTATGEGYWQQVLDYEFYFDGSDTISVDGNRVTANNNLYNIKCMWVIRKEN